MRGGGRSVHRVYRRIKTVNGEEISVSQSFPVQGGPTMIWSLIRGTQRRVPPKYIKNTFLDYPAGVLLDVYKCILSCAMKFVSVRSFSENLSLFEIERALVLFSRKF